MTVAEAKDFLENKVVIDVDVLSAEGIVKTTEALDVAIETMERVELLQAELENAHGEAVKDFSHFLIDKADGGSISVDELPDLVAEWRGLPQSAEPTAPSEKETDAVRHGKWLSSAVSDEYVCSECDGIAPVDCEKEDFYESNYCPNCGAKMDGKEGESNV